MGETRTPARIGRAINRLRCRWSPATGKRLAAVRQASRQSRHRRGGLAFTRNGL